MTEHHETELVIDPEAPDPTERQLTIIEDMSLTAEDISRVAVHLEKVAEAVRTVMKGGINNDYAKIPGTPKISLLKPGAEKLLRLFGLGTRVKRTDCILDREGNFYKVDYLATVFHLQSGKDVASCEGTANSAETKYKKVVAQKGVCDILNTLNKMAQKRGIVGATIIAVGASDYFTQDLEDMKKLKPENASSNRFQNDNGPPGEYLIEVGKFQGQAIKEVDVDDLIAYCTFIKEKAHMGKKEVFGKMKILLDKTRDYLKTIPKKG